MIDLFSGSGGSAQGFKSAGFNIAAAVEIDRLASASFHSNFPETKIFTDDIRNIKGKDLLRTTGVTNNELVILACPPCQGFSTARRRGQQMSDARNILILEFVRLVKEVKPVAFVMENVPGLAKGIGHKLFEEAMSQLADIGYYMTEPQILEAADYGIPQRRKRLVIMGTRLKNLPLKLPDPTHHNPDKKDHGLLSWNTVRSAISDLPHISAGEKHNEDFMHTSAHLSEDNLDRMKHTPLNGGSRFAWPLDLWLPCHIRLEKRGIKGYTDIYGRMEWDTPSPTITGGCAMISKGRYGHPDQNRAISLREAARLQTFPDSFKFTGNFGEIAKQIGNAVPPQLAQRIAESLIKSLNEFSKRVTYVSSFSASPRSKSLSSKHIYPAL